MQSDDKRTQSRDDLAEIISKAGAPPGPPDGPIGALPVTHFLRVQAYKQADAVLAALSVTDAMAEREAAEIELAAAKTSLQFLQGAQPLTRGDLADALGCFWNAAIGAAHRQQSDIGVASVMAEGIGAVAQRLNEPPVGSTAAGVQTAVKWVEQRLNDYVREHGSYDGSTGMTEFSGAGEEYVAELEEIIEGLQKLVSA